MLRKASPPHRSTNAENHTPGGPKGEYITGAKGRQTWESQFPLECGGDARDEALSFALKFRGALQVGIPERGLGGKALQTDFAFERCALFASPDHQELSLDAVVLHVDDFAGSEGTVHAVEQRSAFAHIARGGQLDEGTAIGIDAPNADGQCRLHSRLAASIHTCRILRELVSWGKSRQLLLTVMKVTDGSHRRG